MVTILNTSLISQFRENVSSFNFLANTLSYFKDNVWLQLLLQYFNDGNKLDTKLKKENYIYKKDLRTTKLP